MSLVRRNRGQKSKEFFAMSNIYSIVSNIPYQVQVDIFEPTNFLSLV